uniref:Uncharacterized protein n=1 Tax=Arundo donax TaxID=35708 RepID=A0A0A9A7P2_ARUDO
MSPFENLCEVLVDRIVLGVLYLLSAFVYTLI